VPSFYRGTAFYPAASALPTALPAEQAELRRTLFCREAPSYDEAGAGGEGQIKKRAFANPFLSGFQVDFDSGYVEVFPDGIFNCPACVLRGSGCGGYGFFSLRSFRTSLLCMGLSRTFLNWIVGSHNRSLNRPHSLRNDAGRRGAPFDLKTRAALSVDSMESLSQNKCRDSFARQHDNDATRFGEH
jgi:hypothetical protein